MGRYNAISFDLWATLIRSNPEYKISRDQMIFNHFNPKFLSKEEVSKAIRTVDIRCNQIAQRTGIHVDSKNIWEFVLIAIGCNTLPETIRAIEGECQKLFAKFPPVPYDDNTIPVLRRLVKKNRLYVVSNTAFINGKLLLEVIDQGIVEVISEWRFSDECKISKPNKNIFYKRVDMHVGDDPTTDGGSEQVGVDFFQINTNSKTIKDLL